MVFKKALFFVLLVLVTVNVFGQYWDSDLQVSAVGNAFYSLNVPTGTIKNYLPYYSCFGYGLKVTFKRFLVEFDRFESDLRQLNGDFEFSGPWTKNIPTKLTSNEIIFGYSVINREILQVGVLAGGYQPRIVASDYFISKNKEYKDMAIYSSLAPQVGFSVDVYLPIEDYFTRRTQRVNYFYHFRFRFLYQFSNYNIIASDLKGGYYAIQIACGLSSRFYVSTKRRRS